MHLPLSLCSAFGSLIESFLVSFGHLGFARMKWIVYHSALLIETIFLDTVHKKSILSNKCRAECIWLVCSAARGQYSFSASSVYASKDSAISQPHSRVEPSFHRTCGSLTKANFPHFKCHNVEMKMNMTWSKSNPRLISTQGKPLG